ncbi:unnamed protein product [Prorocentrum cordatum]|uniref:Uncharacterized protein n=1 Tax=Prorocentrum cordatum TaxID=2364126 RepID=A0ABN9TLN0_9DINO|nr:unnamed protein product [Polarella glacialis]
MSDRDQKSALHRVMEDELNTVLKRKKIEEKTTPHKHGGPDAGSPLQDVGAAAADDADMASQDSDDQPLVGAAGKKPSAATPMELDKGQKRSEASEPVDSKIGAMKRPAAAKAVGDPVMGRPAAAKPQEAENPPEVESAKGEAANTPSKKPASGALVQTSKPKAATSAARGGGKAAALKRPAATPSPAPKRSRSSEGLGASSSDDVDVADLGLKRPELQWPGGKKWRARAIEWENPSDFGYGFGQKGPALAKKAWGRLVSKVCSAP